MNLRTVVLALLVCALLSAPTIGNSVKMQGGSNSMVASSGGIVSGGDFTTTDVSSADELGFTIGVRAYAEIPDGMMGSAYSIWSQTNGASKGLSISSGDEYSLEAGYSGSTNVGVKKTSTAGDAASSAEVNARAHVDGETGVLDGSAAISGMILNTGTGEIYSKANGVANYNVRQTASASGLQPVKEAYGGVKGTVYLEAINKGTKPLGKAEGRASITSASQADDTSSSSSSALDSSLTALILDKGSSILVSGQASGISNAGAWDGSTYPFIEKEMGVNDNVLTLAGGAITGTSNAYSPGDAASSSSAISAQAKNTYDGEHSSNEASNDVEMATSINREKSKSNEASVVSRISGGYLDALSRDNWRTPAITYGSASIESIDIMSRMSAKNSWRGDNIIKSNLHALFDAWSGLDTEKYVADISHQVTSDGPSGTGDAADSSEANEQISGQSAKVINEPKIISVSIDDEELQSSLDGKAETPAEGLVLGPISKPVFDTTKRAKHIWTDVSYEPLETEALNSNIIMYEARSSL
jgi:hypothetical protein